MRSARTVKLLLDCTNEQTFCSMYFLHVPVALTYEFYGLENKK